METLKHALIADVDLWKELQALLQGLSDDDDLVSRLTPCIRELIHQSVRIKAAIVNADLMEKGSRRFLNFGHTVGHAIESWHLDCTQDAIGHGEAVACGIICESYISNKIQGLDAAMLNEICRLMKTLFPKSRIQEDSFEILKNKIKSEIGRAHV